MIALAAALATTAAPSVQFLDVEGGRIAFDDAGKGPLVICVPGLGDLRQEYRFLRDRLVAEGFRVVTMDLRGLGDSSVGFAEYTAEAMGRDVVALARHVGRSERAVLVGTSMGAAAVAYAAATAPELVDRVVMIGPFVRQVPPNPWMKLVMGVLFHGPWRVGAWMTYVDSLYPTKKPADWPAMRKAMAANFAVGARFDALNAMLRADRVVVDGLLKDVKAPVLVVMGSKDPDFADPRVEADTVAARLTGAARARVAMVDGAGHYPHAELPELTGPFVLSFLREAR